MAGRSGKVRNAIYQINNGWVPFSVLTFRLGSHLILSDLDTADIWARRGSAGLRICGPHSGPPMWGSKGQ